MYPRNAWALADASKNKKSLLPGLLSQAPAVLIVRVQDFRARLIGLDDDRSWKEEGNTSVRGPQLPLPGPLLPSPSLCLQSWSKWSFLGAVPALILPTVPLQALDKGAALFCLAYTLLLGCRPRSDQSFQLIPKTACPRHNQDQHVSILIQNGWLVLIRIGLFSCFPQFTSIGQYGDLSQGYYPLSSEPIGNQSGGTLGFSKQQNTLHHHHHHHPFITTQHKKEMC